MLTPRNLVTLTVIIAVGALGWLGGSRFTHQQEAGADHGLERPSAQTAGAPADKPQAGDAHDEAEDEHAGHDHGARPEPGAYCDEHRMFEAEDALCNPQLMTTLLPGEGVKMRLATPEAAARAGIVIATAQSTRMADGPAIPAVVVYNRGRLAEVMALAGGVVRRIAAEPGQQVGKGAVLAEIASPGAAAARSDYQTALARLELSATNVRREQELVTKGVSARIDLEQAQAEEQAARASVEQLREQLRAFGAESTTGGMLAVRSPLAGTVVARSAAIGQTLAPETPLFTVTDLSSMWLELQVSPDQLAAARVGAAVEAEFDALPGQRFPGKITQVAAGLDERTRLLQVVAEVANPDGTLKNGLFGQARLVAAAAVTAGATEPKGDHDHDHDAGETDHDLEELFADDADAAPVTIAVPAGAVQSIDGKAYVFVAHEQDLFELRRIVAGPRRGAEVLVISGLRNGEKVVASQGFALKSELLKSRLGASCADH